MMRLSKRLVFRDFHLTKTYIPYLQSFDSHYTLKLSDGPVDFRASFVGYEPYAASFVLKNDTVINIALAQSNQLNEVTVTARAMESNVKGTQMSTIELPMMQMKKIPALFGETDVIKALQLLPGVQSNGLMGLFTEPTQVYSNVQNGVGAVCSQSQPVIVTVDLR